MKLVSFFLCMLLASPVWGQGISTIIGANVADDAPPPGICTSFQLVNAGGSPITLSGTYTAMRGFAVGRLAQRWYASVEVTVGTAQRVVSGTYGALANIDRTFNVSGARAQGYVIADEGNGAVYGWFLHQTGCSGNRCLEGHRWSHLLASQQIVLGPVTNAIGGEGIAQDASFFYTSYEPLGTTNTGLLKIAKSNLVQSGGSVASPLWGTNAHDALDTVASTLLQGAQNTRFEEWDISTTPPTHLTDIAASPLVGGMHGIEIDPDTAANRFWASDTNTVGLYNLTTLANTTSTNFGSNENRRFNGLQYDDVNDKLYDVSYDTVSAELVIRRLTPSTTAQEAILRIAETTPIGNVRNTAQMDTRRQLLLVGLGGGTNVSKVYEIDTCASF